MSSTLKIIVDVKCQIYFDYEFKGEATPNSIFKIDIRKGKYILEFKIDNKLLLSKVYTMQSNDEEDLLNISLKQKKRELEKEEKYQMIAKKNVEIKSVNDKTFIHDIDNNHDIEIDYKIPCLCLFGYHYAIDDCGLISANDNPSIDSLGYFSGGKWGCLNKNGDVQIPFIYDKEVTFNNPKITIAELEGQKIFINKFGEKVFENTFDDVSMYYPNSFNDKNLNNTNKDELLEPWCIVSKNSKKGVIDSKANIVVPIEYDEIKITYVDKERYLILNIFEKWGIYKSLNDCIIPLIYDSINFNIGFLNDLFLVSQNNFYGIIDINNNKILPIEYDNITINYDSISITKNGKSGILNKDFSILVPPVYKMLDNSNLPIVKKNNKYGRINWNLSRGKSNIPFKEIIPCKFDSIYNINGHKCVDNIPSDDFIDYVNYEGNKLHCYHFKIKQENDTYISQKTSDFICEDYHYNYIKNNGKWGINLMDYISYEMPIQLTDEESFYPIYIIKIDSGYALFYQYTKEILPLYAEEIKLIRGKIIAIKLSKWGLYDALNKKTILNCEYDEINVTEAIQYIDERELITRYKFDEECNIVEIKRDIPSDYMLTTTCGNSFENIPPISYDKNIKKVVLKDIDSGKIIFAADSIKEVSHSSELFVGEIGCTYKNGKEIKCGKSFLYKKDFGKLTSAMWFAILQYNVDVYFILQDQTNKYWACDYRIDTNNFDLEIPFFNCRLLRDQKVMRCNEKDKLYTGTENPGHNVKLYIDIETTKLIPEDELSPDKLGNWPHIVQVALILEDDFYGILLKRNYIIEPEGYDIPKDSTKIHKITNEYAIKYGRKRVDIINYLDILLSKVDVIIGHNINFDLNVIKAEIFRTKKYDDVLFKNKVLTIIDTMEIGKNICKIPSLHYHDYKYPKLDELYYHFFKCHFPNQHDAMSDIEATYKCFKKMEELNLNINTKDDLPF